MSAEDVSLPPDPNIVSMKREFKISFPTLPTGTPAGPTLTSEEQIFTLWGKEFKFSFERTMTSPWTLHLVNKCSRAVWINDLSIYYRPKKVSPNGHLRLNEFDWQFEFKDGTICVKGSLLIVVGIQFDPEPSLQQNLLALLNEKKFTDFKLKCGNEEFPCHKSLLAARSSVLAEAFTFSSEESQHEHELKGFNPAALKSLLEIIYTGRDTAVSDPDLQVLADYLNVKLTREQVPELKPFSEQGDLQTLKDWDRFTLSLRHQVQIEPSFAAKNVLFTWTVPNFDAWREVHLPQDIEQLPEKRITFLDKDYSFECHLQLGQDSTTAFLVSRCEGLAFVQGDSYSHPLVVFRPNSFREGWRACKRKGDNLVVSFSIMLLQFLDLENESQLQQELLGLLKDGLDPEKGNKLTDFKIRCGEDEFPCHKAILAVRSPVFAQAFEENPETHQMEMENSQPTKVKQMLEFIYSGTLIEEADQDLLRLADKFQMKDLKKLCGRSLAKKVSLANALDLLDEANSQSDGTLKNLKDSVLYFCADNYWGLRRSDHWQQKVTKSKVVQISDFLMRTREKRFAYE